MTHLSRAFSCLLFCALFFVLLKPYFRESGLPKGEKVGPILLISQKGKKSSYPNENKFLVLNFWADYCGACKREISDMVKIQSRFKDRKVELWGIHKGNIDETKVKRLIKKIKYPLLIDDGTLFRQFRISLLPTTVVINQQGEIVKSFKGQMWDNDWEKILKHEL